MSCSKTQHLVLAGIELPLSGLIQQTTKKNQKKNCYLFYYQENRIWHFIQWRQFAWNANPVFLEEWENISKCLLKTLPRMLSVIVCTNKSRMGLCMAKPTIKLVRRDESACTLWACTSIVWSEPSLIYGFNKTSCATSKDSDQSAQLHILIRAFADRI